MVNTRPQNTLAALSWYIRAADKMGVYAFVIMGKIVQDTDKLAPGVALGVVDEDTEGVDLVFPGEGDTPVQIGVPNGDVRPPGDTTASMPSAAAGERDRGEDQPAADGAPPAQGSDAPDGTPPAAE